MTRHGKATSIHLSAGCVLAALIGCGASNGGVGGTESELTSAAASIDDTVTSADAARAEAKACFDAFRTCEQAAGSDRAACRATLETCLPAEAPLPGRCGGRGDGGVDDDDDDDTDETADEATRTDSDDDVDEAADEAASPDGGVRVRKGRGGDGGVGHGDRDHGKGGKHGKSCGRPDVSADRLGACRSSSRANLTQGMDVAQTSSTNDQCIRAAFSDRLSGLCQRATALCASADAQQDVCTAITQACASATP